MPNPFDDLRTWIDTLQEDWRANRDRNVVDLMAEGFTQVADVLDGTILAGVTYEALDANSDVGTAADQVAQGDHSHNGLMVCLSSYDAEPSRASETNLHGGILSLATGSALAWFPTNIVVTKGTGKLLVVINAGSDIDGSITVTGTTVDRETGATTPADTDTITVDALSTDTTDTDGNGNPRHGFSGAYITSKWFTGTVTLSTADLILTDVDVYHVSFEQFNDTPAYELDTFDANIYTTNVNAEFDAYLYCLQVTGSKCDITREADLNVGTNGEAALANKYWRLRRGNLGIAMVGSTDGIWVDVHYANSPAYVEDVSTKVWALVP